MSTLDAQSLKRFWTDETPSGTINGSNTVFTVSSLPVENEAVDVYVDGIKQIPTTDYSVSGATITFVVAPAPGQSVRVDYIKRRGE